MQNRKDICNSVGGIMRFDKLYDEVYDEFLRKADYDTAISGNKEIETKAKYMIDYCDHQLANLYLGTSLQGKNGYFVGFEVLLCILQDRRIHKGFLKNEKRDLEEKNYWDALCSIIFSIIRFYPPQYLESRVHWLQIYGINEILNWAENRGIITECESANIYLLIEKSSAKNESKKRLRFQWIDCIAIGHFLQNQLMDYIAEKYKEYYLIPAKKQESSEWKIYKQYTDKRNILTISCRRDWNHNQVIISLEKGIRKLYSYSISLVSIETSTPRIQVIDEIDKQLLGSIPFLYAMENDNQINEFFSEIKLSWESKETFFQFVYLYGKDMHDLQGAQHWDFTNEYEIKEEDDNIIIKKTNSDKDRIPDEFFGKKVHCVQTIIGKNGSGKSTFFELIGALDMFQSKPKKDLYGKGILDIPRELSSMKYIVIYRLGNHYYYSSNIKNDSNGEKYQIDAGDLIPYDIKPLLRIVKVSNTFNMMLDTEWEYETPIIWNLNTQYLMQQKCTDEDGHQLQCDGIDINSVQNDEILRFENYRKHIQEQISNVTADDLHDKYGNRLLPKKTLYNGMSRSFSSGETARLQLFARVLSVFKSPDSPYYSLNNKHDYVDNYIILFDEGELYFHPEWQRRLIYDMIRFIEEITSDIPQVRNITLIFSSNSPFYMSDLPASCIHVLTDDTAMKRKTFGQNIHAMLKEQFFMDNVIGEFASSKIKDCFEKLRKAIREKTKLEECDLKTIEYVCDELGEPLIKDLLKEELDAYYEKYPKDKGD